MHDGFRLDGKHCLVTGGTRGIGLEIVRGFLESGATVTLCSRKEANVRDALHQLEPFTSRVLGVVAHLGESDQIHSLTTQAQEKFGHPAVLVNNAGTNPYFGPILDSTEQAWDKTMNVNLKGPYLLSQSCARGMTALGSGSIINIASIAGLMATPDQGIYSVSKAALIMLTKVMAREWGRDGIRVNAICPGLIKTKLSEALWSHPEMERTLIRMKALGRIGNACEIVGAALYFASDASSFTTGSVLQVDGGMVI